MNSLTQIDFHLAAIEFSKECGYPVHILEQAMMKGANIALEFANQITGKADARVTAAVEANVKIDSGETKVIKTNGNGGL